MKNKDKIIKIIGNSSCGITARHIFEELGDVDKTTVYRNLDKLLNSGEVLEEFLKTGEKIYSLKKEHHHHFICDQCGKTVSVGCFFDNNIKNLEKDFGFLVKNHSFVLSGYCDKCKNNN